MNLYATQIELADANNFVARVHRHHDPVAGHRFSVGVQDANGVLHGVAIAGRPVARLTPDREVLEVLRCATDGARNACSFLYGACARVAQILGYQRIQTFTLESEHGASLRASGWVPDGVSSGGQWEHTDGKPRNTTQPTCPKTRWVRVLDNKPPVTSVEPMQPPSVERGLFALPDKTA